jgi:phosphoglycerol transferase MdoB-like AlkP superfamily enzyme
MFCTFAGKEPVQAAKKISLAFFKTLVFWLLFYDLLRILFLWYERAYLSDVSFGSILAVFGYALRLDLSMTAFILSIPFILWLLQSIIRKRWIDLAISIYMFLMIFVFTVITMAELGVYDEWKTKLHYKALLSLAHPSEVIKTAETGTFILLLLLLAGLSFGGWLAWKKWFFVRTADIERSWSFTILFSLIAPGLLLTGMRGGFQQIPVNQSSCYFSNRDILNLAAVNSGWNLMQSVYENSKVMKENPFIRYPQQDALGMVQEIRKVSCDSTLSVLRVKRPNIVMFILEGWSAEVSDSLGGDPGISPWLSQMASEGLLFSEISNSGTRSQQGIAALFSAYPCFPYSTLTQHPDKYMQLPSMIQSLDSAGYSTSFTFGGALNYGNLRSYLSSLQFDRITEQSDLPSSLPSGKLGIHDEYMFPVFCDELGSMKAPFFSALFTMSTHSPYDQQMPELFPQYQFERRYVNAVHYSDQCLKAFFSKARQQSWYANTLFILVSDHSHGTYTNREYYDPQYSRIVCMFYGDVLDSAYRGKKIEKMGSQTDLCPTLLRQMGLNYHQFVWGKDLLDPCSQDYAYYSFEVGFGWRRPYGHYAYDYRIDKTLSQQCDSTNGHRSGTLEREGKSYLQVLYQDFLDL